MRDDSPPHSPAALDRDRLTIDQVRTSYRRYARVYDWLFGAILSDGRRKALQEVATLRPRRILEIGVGTGLMLAGYPHDAEVIGIDISEDMIAVARRRIDALALRNARVEVADGEQLHYADGYFDCVVLPYVLSVTPSPSALVSEAIRVCAKDGRIVVINHFSGSRFWRVLELAAAPLARRIGFRSTFNYADHVLAHPWRVQKLLDANLLGLSKVVVLAPGGPTC